MNWNHAEQWAKPDHKPMGLGESFQEAISQALASPRTSDRTPEVIMDRVWQEIDLWAGIPKEFQGAILSDALKGVLRQTLRPLSFALVGPPGTGKTRSLWAMTGAMRRRAAASWIGSPIYRERFSEGQYSSRLETYDQAIARELTRIDGLRIVTEVGDIRAKRYDREALNEWAETDQWLAVDDIGAMEPNEWVREAIYHLANERRAHGRTTVWTSNLTPQQLRDTFGGAIASRILGGAVVEVSGADRRVQ